MDIQRILTGLSLFYIVFSFRYYEVNWQIISLFWGCLNFSELYNFKFIIYDFESYIWLVLYTFVSWLCITFQLNRDYDILYRLIILVSLSDSIQYLFGRLGNHQINFGPSPHKTWGGYLSSLISILLGVEFLNFKLSLSAILVFSGIMGDLFVSFIKRRLGVKDISNLLGSHGGWLDRTDGINMAVLVLTLINFFEDDIYG